LDYAGIEAAITAWAIWRHLGDARGAQHYLRMCRLGLHGIVTSNYLRQPINLTQPDEVIAQEAGHFKEHHPYEYDIVKRADHGTHYGLTPFGMVEMFPSFFRSVKHAQEIQGFLFKVAPALPAWHTAVRKQAREVGYLGGPTLPGATPSIWDHPYGYKHWFWDVLTYRPVDEVKARQWLANPMLAGRIVILHGRYFKIDWGGDSKRAIAFYPQSIAAGVLKRAELRLFHPDSPDYIGDAYFGRTPLLHPIHDSLFLHVPVAILDRVVAICARVMQDELPELPIPAEWGLGRYLRIGVEAKAGRTWDKKAMNKVHVDPIIYGVEHPEDPPVIAREAEDQDQWDALQRVVA
jgi:hypothetical protein